MQQSLEDFALQTPAHDFWVFGYGSLMWNPGFRYKDMQTAHHFGHHRAFAMQSIRHRGTPERPGLVLTLCPGGSCIGRAFLIDRLMAADVCGYLLDREIGSYAYRPGFITISMQHEKKQALTFLPKKGAAQFIPHLTNQQQAEAIAGASGGMGPNPEYLRNTIREMRSIGLPIGQFQALEEQILSINDLA